jgi:anti-repressor protein
MINTNELIPIAYHGDKPAVSARDLHEFLEVGSDFSHWFKRMCEYGFDDGTDFASFLTESTGGRPSTDATLSIDMAKEICMLQRNEKGKEARQYFLQLEKDWNSPEKVMARALKIADLKINALSGEVAKRDQIIAELNPKATYYDLVLQCSGAVSPSKIAKDYGKSAIWLNEKLHELGIQFKQGKVWLLYQKHASFGYTQSKTFPIVRNGEPDTEMSTYWTQKGRLFIYELLKQNGIVPLIERDGQA